MVSKTRKNIKCSVLLISLFFTILLIGCLNFDDFSLETSWNTFSEIEIAKWKDGHEAALSFSFDDALITHQNIGYILVLQRNLLLR